MWTELEPKLESSLASESATIGLSNTYRRQLRGQVQKSVHEGNIVGCRWFTDDGDCVGSCPTLLCGCVGP